MKGVKGKLLKKLKSIKQISSLKAERVLHLKASDGYADFLQKIPSFNLPTPFVSREKDSQKAVQSCENVQEQENTEAIDVCELMRDLEEEEEEDMDSDDYNDNKENIVPCLLKSEGNVTILQNRVREETGLKQSGGGVLKEKRSPLVLSSRADGGGSKRKTPMSEIDISSFRRPDLNSGSLFDPNLLAAFEEALKEHAMVTEEQRRDRVEEEKHSQNEDNGDDEDPLMLFEEKCPPGGETTVIFYTTSLRGIRKTFEDCSKIRFLLQSFKVLYFERDISMDKGFRDELWSILDGKTVPPRLFVKGRYIGGAEEVVSLHEQGKLKKLLEGVPRDHFDGPCDACGGVRFVLCFKCNGSHKVIAENEEKGSTQCPQCNENGLIVCPYCC